VRNTALYKEYQFARDLHSDSGSERIQVHDEATGPVLFCENAVKITQTIMIDLDRSPIRHVLPGLHAKPRSHEALEGVDFRIRDRYRMGVSTDSRQNVSCRYHCKPITRSKAAKKIAGEKRQLKPSHPVGPSPYGLECRKEYLEAFRAQGDCHLLLAMMANP
jgi:hypothetical protein